MTKNKTAEYRQCTQCIMDTSDPDISFNEQGLCNHCIQYKELARNELHHGPEAHQRLQTVLNNIKQSGKNQPYDCLLGVSGGVDSSYVAYQAKKLGLRPLAVHLDNGWDSELAVDNIKNLLSKLNIDLHTYVIEWEEFKNLQIAFLKASTPDSEIPTDHAILATLYQAAAQYNIHYLIMGSNVVTEAVGPTSWSYGHVDWKYIRAIHRQFGSGIELKTYPHLTLSALLYYKLIKRQKSVSLLNYLDYNKSRAKWELQEKLGWRDYGGKHFESIYTRFFQGYILPKKFGYDKRRAHLSTLILSGQITRSEALGRMNQSDYPPETQQQDKEYVQKKLGLTPDEFDAIMNAPRKTFWDYPSYEKNPLYRYIISQYPRLKKLKLI